MDLREKSKQEQKFHKNKPTVIKKAQNSFKSQAFPK